FRCTALTAIWAHFKINDDDRSKAQCKICTATVSRGEQESPLLNTSNLIKHLKKHHSAKYTEFTDASGARPKQPILTDVLQKKKMRTHTQRERERERGRERREREREGGGEREREREREREGER